MKSSHTPGKWETGSLMSQVITWREERPVPICIADCGTKLSPNDEDERCSNARLIAAAPELLEACKFALRLSEANLSELLDEGEQESGGNVQAERQNIKTFTDAITKAEGK